MKISGVYKITNAVTGDFYIGSSNDVKRRWKEHKCTSRWNKCPNNPMYIDMRKYRVDKFEMQIIAEVEEEKLKETEQQFIEKLNPTYNSCNAKGRNIERRKKYCKEYEKSDKRKESHKKSSKEYQKSDKGKDSHKKANNKYQNQLCIYNCQTLTLCALSTRFRRQGIPHPTLEAKKYIIKR